MHAMGFDDGHCTGVAAWKREDQARLCGRRKPWSGGSPDCRRTGKRMVPANRVNLETAVEEDFKTRKGPSHPGGWAHGQEPKGSPCE